MPEFFLFFMIVSKKNLQPDRQGAGPGCEVNTLKILGLSFSRGTGQYRIIADKVFEGAKRLARDRRAFRVAGKTSILRRLRICFKTVECHIRTDMQDLYKKMLEADALFSAPFSGLFFTYDGSTKP